MIAQRRRSGAASSASASVNEKVLVSADTRWPSFPTMMERSRPDKMTASPAIPGRGSSTLCTYTPWCSMFCIDALASPSRPKPPPSLLKAASKTNARPLSSGRAVRTSSGSRAKPPVATMVVVAAISSSSSVRRSFTNAPATRSGLDGSTRRSMASVWVHTRSPTAATSGATGPSLPYVNECKRMVEPAPGSMSSTSTWSPSSSTSQSIVGVDS